MRVIHFVVGGTAGAADSDEVLLVHLVCDLGKLALFAANVLRNELVEMALKIRQ